MMQRKFSHLLGATLGPANFAVNRLLRSALVNVTAEHAAMHHQLRRQDVHQRLSH